MFDKGETIYAGHKGSYDLCSHCIDYTVKHAKQRQIKRKSRKIKITETLTKTFGVKIYLFPFHIIFTEHSAIAQAVSH